MKINRILACLLVLTVLFGLCACAGETPAEGEAVTVTDMVGREVSIVPGSYKNVVCVGAGALRMYCYIGDVNLLCGVEDIDNTNAQGRPAMFDSVARPYVLAWGDVFNTLPSCGVGGPNAQSAEAEKILACGADIVISEYEDADKANALQEQLGIPVITLKAGPRSVFDDMFAGSMELLGKIFGAEERAAELVSFVKAEAAAISRRVSEISVESKPSVYVCGLGNWGTANHLTTAESYVSFQVAGVKNVLSGLGMTRVGPIEAEKFVELGEHMDIIILDAAAVKNIKPLYQEDPTLFDTCKAWRDGEVYLEMAFNAYYTNFEIALINTWFIAKTVYPELFTDIDITEKTNEITKMFLGKELAADIFACPSSFGGYQKIDPDTFFG